MTGWLIFLGIILVILGILMLPVRIVIDYKENFSLVIKFLLFFKYKVFPRERKPKAEKESQKTEKKNKTEQQSKQKKKRKMTAEEMVDFVIKTVEKYGNSAKMILRNIRVHRFELYWKVGAEDAAACGIKYGKICAWLSSTIAFFRNLMKIENTKLRIYPDFISEKDEIYGGADIEFNPLIVLIGAIRMAFVFIKDMIKGMSAKSKKTRRNVKKDKTKEKKEHERKES